MRIVAGRAGELVAARSEQEVASFAGVRGAPPGGALSRVPFPGERVAREEHGVALLAGAVHVLGSRRRTTVRRFHAHEVALQRERGARGARILCVQARPAVTGFAPDAELDQVLLVEVLVRDIG